MPAIANPPPWLNKVCPTEELVRATSAHDPILRNRLLFAVPLCLFVADLRSSHVAGHFRRGVVSTYEEPDAAKWKKLHAANSVLWSDR
jgi:hypothetical protein